MLHEVQQALVAATTVVRGAMLGLGALEATPQGPALAEPGAQISLKALQRTDMYHAVRVPCAQAGPAGLLVCMPMTVPERPTTCNLSFSSLSLWAAPALLPCEPDIKLCCTRYSWSWWRQQWRRWRRRGHWQVPRSGHACAQPYPSLVCICGHC